MATIRAEVRRKLELLERYRSIRQEEILEEMRFRAERELGEGRFPWKGEFRPKTEIEELYKRRKRWGIRFTVDLALVSACLAAIVWAGPFLIRLLLPR
ncbi:MAG TPA: hypothetical protein QGG59_09810 [Planctomycetota bacterium]|nr:hypothetical protein [Planctomycetota bacterium]HJM40400.1 hypothetical protein [Planctomycetota bacterium]|tara:strand:+ start:7528 stop:7821 length:294 start_codon:yes stop_codon:yes gene_type:complete